MSRFLKFKACAVLAVTSLIVSGCGHSSKNASVSVTSDPPLSVTSGPLDYKTGDATAWFQHDLMVENLGDKTVVINYDNSRSGRFLGNNQLLVLDDGCGPGSPLTGEALPTVTCTAVAHGPTNLAPHASAKLTTITAYKGLNGMSSIKHGSYEWDKDLAWRFADASDAHTSHVKLTYIQR